MARSISPGLCERRSAGRPAVAQESEGGSTTCHAVAEAKVKHLSAIDSFLLSLNHFLKLRTKHIHLAAHQVAPQGNVQPVSLLALDDEFVGLRNVQWFGLRKAGSAINYRQSTSGFPNLLVDDLDLFVDDLAGETIDRDMHPVMLLACDDEFFSSVCTNARNFQL